MFGEKAQPLTLLETNIIFFVYFLTIFHLRHSHLWLPIRGWMGYIIQSPAHHQIHHSTAPRHIGKNLGFSLSLWDWAFGTLYMPDKREALEYGLGAESADFASVKDLLLQPFRDAHGRHVLTIFEKNFPNLIRRFDIFLKHRSRLRREILSADDCEWEGLCGNPDGTRRLRFVALGGRSILLSLGRFAGNGIRPLGGGSHRHWKLHEARKSRNFAKGFAAFRETNQKFLRVEMEAILGHLRCSRIRGAHIIAIFQ